MSQEKTYEIAPETVAGVAAGVAVGAAIKAVNEILYGQGSATVRIGENEIRELSDGIAQKVISMLEDNNAAAESQDGVKETVQAAASGIMSELFDLPFAADRLNTRTRKVFDSIPPNSVGAILDLGAEGLRQYDGVGAKTAAEIYGIATAQENEFSLPVEIEEDDELQSDLEEQEALVEETPDTCEDKEVFEDEMSDVESGEDDEESMITEMEQSFEDVVAQVEGNIEEDEVAEDVETFAETDEVEEIEEAEEEMEDVVFGVEDVEEQPFQIGEDIREAFDAELQEEPVESEAKFDEEPVLIEEESEEFAFQAPMGIVVDEEPGFQEMVDIEDEEESDVQDLLDVEYDEELDIQGLVDIEDDEELEPQGSFVVEEDEEPEFQGSFVVEEDEEPEFQGSFVVEEDEDPEFQGSFVVEEDDEPENVVVEEEKLDQDMIGVAIDIEPERQEIVEFEDDDLEGVISALPQDQEYIEIPNDISIDVEEKDDLAVAADVNMFVDDHLAATDEVVEDVSSIADDFTSNLDEDAVLTADFDEAEFEDFLDNDPDEIGIELEPEEAEAICEEEVKSFTGAFMPQMSEEDIAHAVEDAMDHDEYNIDPVATAVTYDNFMDTMVVEVPDSVVAAEERIFAGLGHSSIPESVEPSVSVSVPTVESVSVEKPVEVNTPVVVSEPVAAQETISYDFDDFDDIGDLEDTDDDDFFIDADVPVISNIVSGVQNAVAKVEEKVENVSESVEKTLDVEDSNDVIADLLAKMEARKLEFGKFVEQTRKNED